MTLIVRNCSTGVLFLRGSINGETILVTRVEDIGPTRTLAGGLFQLARGEDERWYMINCENLEAKVIAK